MFCDLNREGVDVTVFAVVRVGFFEQTLNRLVWPRRERAPKAGRCLGGA